MNNKETPLVSAVLKSFNEYVNKDRTEEDIIIYKYLSEANIAKLSLAEQEQDYKTRTSIIINALKIPLIETLDSTGHCNTLLKSK